MGVYITQASFVRGEVDERAKHRADAELSQTGALNMVNFVPRLAGGLQKRNNLGLPEFMSVASFSYTHAQNGVPISTYAYRYRGMDVFIQLDYHVTNNTYYIGMYLRLCQDGFILDQVTETQLATLTNEVDNQITVPRDLPFDANKSNPDPLHWHVNFSRMGPSVFITSPYFNMRRVYIDFSGDTSTIHYEIPSFFEELYGEVFVYDTETLVFIDGAAVEVLSVGGTINYNDAETTISDIYGYGSPDSSNNNTPLDEWVYEDYPNARGVKMENAPYSNMVYGRNAPTGLAYRPTTDPFGGNPHLTTFHQGRFFVFSTWDNPTRVWAAKPQNPFVIKGNAEDVDSPIEYDLAADKAEVFIWVSAQDQILLGTNTAEYMIDSLSDEPVSPGSFGFYKVSEQGASNVKPTQSDSAMFLVPRNQESVAVFQYDESVQGFKAQYLTSVSSHLFEGGVIKLEYEAPRSDSGTAKIYAIVNKDNKRRLVACVFDQEAGVIGWFQYEFNVGYEVLDLVEEGGYIFVVLVGAASSDSDSARVIYCSMTSAPEGIAADLFARNGVSDYYGTPIVKLGDMYSSMEGNRLFVLDSVYLWKGEYEVQYNPENGYYIDVSNSGLAAGDDAYTGVSFTSTLEMFPPSPGLEAVNRKKRVVRTFAGVYRAADLRINHVSALQGPPKLGLATNDLVGGTFEVRTLGWGPDHTTTLESSWPYDCTILSVTREVQVT